MANILLTNKPHSEFPHSRPRSFQNLCIMVKLKSLQSLFGSYSILIYIYNSCIQYLYVAYFTEMGLEISNSLKWFHYKTSMLIMRSQLFRNHLGIDKHCYYQRCVKCGICHASFCQKTCRSFMLKVIWAVCTAQLKLRLNCRNTKTLNGILAE